MKRVVAMAVAFGAITESAPARADAEDRVPRTLRLWSGSNALTVPNGRWEFGLFGASHYGLTDWIELSMHPLLVVVLPHLEAKLMAARDARHVLGLRARASYPTTFLDIVAKEGQFGLLPATSKPPLPSSSRPTRWRRASGSTTSS